MNLKSMDKKAKNYFVIVIGAMMLILLLILIISIAAGGRVSFTVGENKIKQAAISYFAAREDELPIVGKSTTISIDKLVETKKLKSLDKLFKNKDAVCTGSVTVTNNNSFYLYSVNLDCKDDYKTEFLYNKVLSDNTYTSTGEGLYKINNESVFRGEDLNNYVTFAEKTWLIVKINADNSLKLINYDESKKSVWDNRYNKDVKSSTGINNYRVSRIKDYVEEFYNDEDIFNSKQKAYIVAQNVCLDSKASDAVISNSTCIDVLENQYITLLEIGEFVTASIDKDCNSLDDVECTNYNYLANFDRAFWSITSSKEATNLVYQFSPAPYAYRASTPSTVKPVINLSSNAIYSKGDGSLENPYVIKND